MPYASYQLTRRLLSWRWEADFRGDAATSGWALTKCGARRAARNWIRGRQAGVAVSMPTSVPEPVRMAA